MTAGDEAAERRAGEIVDDSEPDAARTPALDLDGTDDNRLVAGALAATLLLPVHATDIGFVDFHRPESRSRSGRTIARRSFCSIAQAVS
ncbi:MAG: hypothetical protein R3D28_01075 [Geminicoccaceae bacterium]